MAPPSQLSTLGARLLPVAIAAALTAGSAAAQAPVWRSAGLEGGWVRSLAVAPTDGQRIYAVTAGGLFRSSDGGTTWSRADEGIEAPDLINVVAVSATSAEILWAGTGVLEEGSPSAFLGGLFKSTDGGRTWSTSAAGIGQPPFDVPVVRGLAADPDAPQRLVAGTSSGLFTSSDGGASWQPAAGPLLDTRAVALSTADPRVVYAATDGGVWRSDDGGESWVSASSGLPSSRVRSIAVDPTAPETVLAGTDSGLARSSNGGTSWTAVPLGSGADEAAVLALAIDPTGTRLFAAASRHGLFRSLDSGASWSPAGQGLPPGVAIASLAVDPAEPATLFAGSAALGVFRSRNGGDSWGPVHSGLTATNVRALLLDPATPGAPWAGTAAGVFRRQPETEDWSMRNSGLLDELGQPTEVRTLVLSPDGSLFAGTRRGVFFSARGGASWVSRSVGLEDFFGTPPVDTVAFDPTQAAVLYAGTRAGVFKSVDGGASWQLASNGIAGLFGARNATALAVDPFDPATLYAGGFGSLFKTTDGAASWRRSDAGLGGGVFGSFFDVEAIRLDPSNPGLLFAATSSGAFRSRDAGESWVPINRGISPLPSLLSLPVFDLVVDPTDPGALWASSFDGVFHSATAGDEWQPAGLEKARIQAFAIAPIAGGGSELWAGSRASGVFSSAPISTEPLFLGGGRFRIDVVWRDPAGHVAGGQPIPLTPDTGALWFFQPDNVELLVKVLDGRAINGHFWVFYGALSDVEYSLTVTDTTSGARKTYLNPAGTLASSADTMAFRDEGESILANELARKTATTASPPPRQATGCKPTSEADDGVLCLLDQFEVRVDWQDFTANSGQGTAIDLTGDTGLFWFFDDANVELAVKVLDGRAINGHFWVFFGSLSNVAFTVTVTDTASGVERTYDNPLGTFGSRADTSAF